MGDGTQSRGTIAVGALVIGITSVGVLSALGALVRLNVAARRDRG